MQDLINIVLVSFWCLGWHHLYQPGQALYFISRPFIRMEAMARMERDYALDVLEQAKHEMNYKVDTEKIDVLKRKFNIRITHEEKENAAHEHYEEKLYWLKPLFLCPVCFASLYGSAGFGLIYFTEWGIAPVSVIGLVAMNKLFHKIIG